MKKGIIIIVFLFICVLVSSCMSDNGLFNKVTPTIIPTLTPTIIPTITPTSTLTADEEIAFLYYYLNTRIEKLERCQNSMQLLSEELNSVVVDQNVLFDPKSIEDLYSAIFNFDLYCTNLSSSNPPYAFIEFNSYLEKASELYQLSVTNLRLGIDQLDANYINVAADYLNQGSEYITLATAKISSY